MSSSKSSDKTPTSVPTDNGNFPLLAVASVALGVGSFYLGQLIVRSFKAQRSEEDEWIRQLGGEVKEEVKEEEKPSCIYLDYNGTTPIYKEVIAEMMPFLSTHFGNPSASHAFGAEPKRAIQNAREQILQLLGANINSYPLNSVWFTGSGTETDNMAIQLALQSSGHISNPHIVASNVEHPAIEGYLKHLEDIGKISVTFVPVQRDGRVLAKDMIDALKPSTILVTLMVANNETGALQPVKAIAEECRKRGILMHTDAAQAVGKVSVELADLGHPDMISIVGHKIGAPKGIAALYVRSGCLEENARRMPHSHGVMLIGGGQEFGRRAGTENTPYIVGFGHAAQRAHQRLAKNARHMESLRSRLLKNLEKELGAENVRANGPQDSRHRLPNTLSVGLKGVNSAALLNEIGQFVAATAGATCHGTGEVSAILRVMNVPIEFARGTLRLSVGPQTTTQEVDRATKIIAGAARLQLHGNAAGSQSLTTTK
eukprot:Nitzschia sp. Nitz4//scaffold53_size117307//17398//18855//NITZ4_003756-RA/size117307-processed-gene-0.25-mRNA-1//-1//CDS//3329554163//7675//frame0